MLQTPKPAGKGALVPAGGDIWGHGGTKASKPGDGVKAGGAAKSFRFLFEEEGCYHSGAKPGEMFCSGLVKFWGGALKAKNRGRGFSEGSCRGFGRVLTPACASAPLRLVPSPVLGVFLNTACEPRADKGLVLGLLDLGWCWQEEPGSPWGGRGRAEPSAARLLGVQIGCIYLEKRLVEMTQSHGKLFQGEKWTFLVLNLQVRRVVPSV